MLLEGDDLEDEISEFTLGKKRKIKLSEIDAAGNLEQYKSDLKKDIDTLDNLFINLKRFEGNIKREVIKQNIKSSDKYKAENFDLITWFLVS